MSFPLSTVHLPTWTASEDDNQDVDEDDMEPLHANSVLMADAIEEQFSGDVDRDVDEREPHSKRRGEATTSLRTSANCC